MRSVDHKAEAGVTPLMITTNDTLLNFCFCPLGSNILEVLRPKGGTNRCSTKLEVYRDYQLAIPGSLYYKVESRTRRLLTLAKVTNPDQD